MEPEKCPNCGAAIKKSTFSNNQLIDPAMAELIDSYAAEKRGGYCFKCIPAIKEKTLISFDQEIQDLERRMFMALSSVRIISAHSPSDWNYETISVVTGQAVMGTGIFTEISSGFSDLFGSASEALSEKIRAGEKSCFAQIKKQAIERGGNAILALDIDYNELGGVKGMVMVCMTGTAVRLKDANGEAPELYAKHSQRLKFLKEKRPYLQST
jgi:uncharacterized protein YbjQ (UPF0145 family)